MDGRINFLAANESILTRNPEPGKRRSIKKVINRCYNEAGVNLVQHVCAVLYVDGSVDFYYNFRIVSTISTEEATIEDIEPDRDRFYCLCKTNLEIFYVPFDWKEMMGFKTREPAPFNSAFSDTLTFWRKIPHYTIRLFAMVYSDVF